MVEFDLRSPSMFTGKKGFDRLIYAAKNVFKEPVTWLFCNVAQKGKSCLDLCIDAVKCSAVGIV